MFSYQLSLMHNPSILITTLSRQFKITEHLPAYIDEVRAELNILEIPVFLVIDATHLQISFSDLIIALRLIAHPKNPVALVRHPSIRQIIGVSEHSLVKMGINTLTQKDYGNLPAKSFPTLDEAFAYIQDVADEADEADKAQIS